MKKIGRKPATRAVEENKPVVVGDAVVRRVLLEAQDLQGPVGPKGEKGRRGRLGPTGSQGEQGVRGPSIPGVPGKDGKSIQGPIGRAGEVGVKGPRGAPGLPPAHKWKGTKLSFENPDGSFSNPVDLKGDTGGRGMSGAGGGAGRGTQNDRKFLLPQNDQFAGQYVGSPQLRWDQMHSRLGVFVGTSLETTGLRDPRPDVGTRTFATDQTGIMIGNQIEAGAGESLMQLGASGGIRWKAAILAGTSAAYGDGSAQMINTAGGGSLFGTAFNYGDLGDMVMRSDGFGCFTTGYAIGGSGDDLTIRNRSSGGFLSAYVSGYGKADALAYGSGCFVSGYMSNFNPLPSVQVMEARGGGSFCSGHSYVYYGAPTGRASNLQANGYGAFAQGRVYATAGYDATISSSGLGSFAQGETYGGTITSSGAGSFAQGRAYGGYGITASANGAFAQGHAYSGSIIASASNAAQFGPGTNALADTLQIGSAGLRFKGTVNAPAAPQNGDHWLDGSGNVVIRSGGVSVTIA